MKRYLQLLFGLTGVQKVALLLLFAVILRLLLMPFFMHMDLLSEYRRVNYSVENLQFYPGVNRIITFWIECAFYSVTQFFMVNRELLLHLPDPLHSTSSPTQHFIFVDDPHIFRHLFLFKLPYLLFDLLAARLVWLYFVGSRWQFIALALWLFNPVTLYATYVFGRFEVISLFFLIATALSLQRKRWVLAALCFGLAINSREINLIYLPAFLAALYYLIRHVELSSVHRWLSALAAAALLLLCWRLPQIIVALFDVQPLFNSIANVADIERGTDAFVKGKFAGVYPFFLLLGVSALVIFRRSDLPPHTAFLAAALATVVAFFSTGFHSAHYFAWIIPFLVLSMRYTEHLLLPIIALIACWIIHWMLNPEGAYFTPLLATPLHESFFGLGSLTTVYQKYFAHHPLLDVRHVRTASFSGAVACMLIILVRSLSQLREERRVCAT